LHIYYLFVALEVSDRCINLVLPHKQYLINKHVYYFKLQYSKTWLETKVKEHYVNSSISSADILQSVITLLNSPRSNEEMQNDFFELLGFDKFEFIQEMLEHRQEIIDSLRAPVQPTISESEYSI
jgi:hypothetical protein